MKLDDRREEPMSNGDRRNPTGFWRTDMGQKVIVALAVPFIVAVAAYASGMIELPTLVRQHESRIIAVEQDTRALREGAIKRDAQLEYLVKRSDEILGKIDRMDRGRR